MKTKIIIATFALAVVALFSIAAVPPSSGNASLLKTTPVATNLWSATTSGARVYSISALNSSATDQWLFVFNTNSATVANNSSPGVAPVLIPAGKTGGFDFGEKGCPFTLGVTVGNSTTDRTLTNGSANFIITVIYDGN